MAFLCYVSNLPAVASRRKASGLFYILQNETFAKIPQYTFKKRLTGVTFTGLPLFSIIGRIIHQKKLNYFQIFFAESFYQLLRIVEEQNGFGLFDFGFSFKSFHESQQGKGENLSTTSTRLTDTSTGSKPSSQHNHGT